MANEPARKPSFSLRQRWGIFFSVLISIGAVFALVVMVNYLGARYYLRFPWSMQTRAELSPQTVNVLKSLTNEVKVVIYYDKKDPLYGDIKDLLNEYRLINPKISVRTVDYVIDASEAQKVKDTYGVYMDALVDTNVVIFSSPNGTNVVQGEKLSDHTYEPDPSAGPRNFRDKLTYFHGEEDFTDAIFRVTSSRPVRAYFWEPPESMHRLNGQRAEDYQNFKSLLQSINIDVTNLTSLTGTNGVPADCKLLIIAGPGILLQEQRDSVRNYLDRGGRLFALFNHAQQNINTGLERILAKWGITVRGDTVQDPNNSYAETAVVVSSFSKNHPAVKNLRGFSLELVLPRTIETNSNGAGPEGSGAQEIAWTGSGAKIDDSAVTTGKPVPLIAAVERGDAKGITEQGPTRIIVVGDSYCLDNQFLGTAAKNKEFAGYAVNWLVGQNQLLQGIGPQSVTEYRLMLTPTQSQSLQWIFLAAMPGSILLIGSLVWLRRRR